MSTDDRPLVAHVITGLNVGGAERMLARIAMGGVKCRHSVIVLGELGPTGELLRSSGIEVTPLRAHGLLDGALGIPRLYRELVRLRPAVAQSWLVHANLACALATPPGVPLAWSVRHTLEGFDREKLATRIAVRAGALASRRARAIVYNSTAAADQHEAIGYPAAGRQVFPNGFDTAEAGLARAGRDEVRAELGLTPEALAIGLVARVHPIKNHGAFLAAGAALAAEFPRARFVLVGAGTEPGGNLASSCPPALRARTIWLGERSDVARVTAALDIACNVSLGEAFSNAIGEAMACAVPCVVTNVGESAAIVGETGWVAGNPGAPAITDALRAALAATTADRAARGAAAWRRIEDHFSVAAAVASYEHLYLTLA